jgi:hypothetical protein
MLGLGVKHLCYVLVEEEEIFVGSEQSGFFVCAIIWS